MEHEKIMPEEEGEETNDLGIKVGNNLEVTTKKMREEDEEHKKKIGDDAWREQE